MIQFFFATNFTPVSAVTARRNQKIARTIRRNRPKGVNHERAEVFRLPSDRNSLVAQLSQDGRRSCARDLFRLPYSGRMSAIETVHYSPVAFSSLTASERRLESGTILPLSFRERSSEIFFYYGWKISFTEKAPSSYYPITVYEL